MLDVVRRNPGFRRLWFAQVVSQCGDWLSRMAILQLIAELGGQREAAGIGSLYAIEIATRLLPTSVMGSIAGPIADRLPRRALMILADFVRAGVVLCLLLVRDPGDLTLLYVLVILQMSTSIFADSARSASVPNTVPREELHDAATLNALTWSVMLSVGALAGGVLVGWIGTRGVFLLDAASYLVSASILVGLRLPPPPSHVAPLRWRNVLFMTELREGLGHARALSIAPTIFAKALWGGAGGFLVLLSVASKERFAVNSDELGITLANTIGLFYAARGLGTGLGPVIVRRFHGTGEAHLRTQITGGFLVGAAGYALFAVAHSFPLALFFVFLAHCGGSTLWVASTTLWQRHVEDRYRGRVFALEFLGMTLAFSLGGLCTGLVYDATGSIPWSTWSACLLVLLGCAVWIRQARSLPIET